MKNYLIKIRTKWISFNPYTYEIVATNFKPIQQDCAILIPENKEKDSVLKTVCLCISEICNMRCKYCFESAGSFRSTNTYMSLSTAIKVYEELAEKDSIETITYYGGEPLLNKQLIYDFTQYVKDSNPNIIFNVITNGTLIDRKFIEFISKHNFALTVSFDGIKDYHNRTRVYQNGKGSYEDIVKNLKDIDLDKIYLGGEITLNADFFEHFIKSDIKKMIYVLNEISFRNYDIYVADGEEYNKKATRNIIQFYSGLVDESFRILQNNINTTIPNSIIAMLYNMANKKYGSVCGAGSEYIFVNANGELFPCQTYYMVKNKKEIDMELIWLGRRNKLTRNQLETCIECHCIGICNNYCPGSSFLFNGEEKKPLWNRCLVTKIIFKRILYNIGTMEKDTLKKFMENCIHYSKKHSYTTYVKDLQRRNLTNE